MAVSPAPELLGDFLAMLERTDPSSTAEPASALVWANDLLARFPPRLPEQGDSLMSITTPMSPNVGLGPATEGEVMWPLGAIPPPPSPSLFHLLPLQKPSSTAWPSLFLPLLPSAIEAQVTLPHDESGHYLKLLNVQCKRHQPDSTASPVRRPPKIYTLSSARTPSPGSPLAPQSHPRFAPSAFKAGDHGVDARHATRGIFSAPGPLFPRPAGPVSSASFASPAPSGSLQVSARSAVAGRPAQTSQVERSSAFGQLEKVRTIDDEARLVLVDFDLPSFQQPEWGGLDLRDAQAIGYPAATPAWSDFALPVPPPLPPMREEIAPSTAWTSDTSGSDKSSGTEHTSSGSDKNRRAKISLFTLSKVIGDDGRSRPDVQEDRGSFFGAWTSESDLLAVDDERIAFEPRIGIPGGVEYHRTFGTWSAYRRNHLSLAVSLRLPGLLSSGSSARRTTSSESPVERLEVEWRAETFPGGNAVELLQLDTKRSRTRTPLRRQALEPVAASAAKWETEGVSTNAEDAPSSSGSFASPPSTTRSSEESATPLLPQTYSTTFHRVQYRHSTANHPRHKLAASAFVMRVSVVAVHADGSESRMGGWESQRHVVLGRHPKMYGAEAGPGSELEEAELAAPERRRRGEKRQRESMAGGAGEPERKEKAAKRRARSQPDRL